MYLCPSRCRNFASDISGPPTISIVMLFKYFKTSCPIGVAKQEPTAFEIISSLSLDRLNPSIPIFVIYNPLIFFIK
tara:strand:+ start:1237 stop:1464 length:228 start_codon:yes stop_codon:yes gene_type:complete